VWVRFAGADGWLAVSVAASGARGERLISPVFAPLHVPVVDRVVEVLVVGQVTVPAFLSVAAGFIDGLLRTVFVSLAASRCGISCAAGW